MIEIRADGDDRPVTPDGPHSPERTRAVAAGIDSAVRLLSYATSPEKHGLAYPSDVYTVLGELSAALHKLPQALQQMTRFIDTRVAEGAARENPRYGGHAGNAGAASAELAAALRGASAGAADLAALLGRAQSAISGLEGTG